MRKGSCGRDILVSTLGLELASRTLISPEQIEYARAGLPSPRFGGGDWTTVSLTNIPKHRPSIEEIGATIVRTNHINEDEIDENEDELDATE